MVKMCYLSYKKQYAISHRLFSTAISGKCSFLTFQDIDFAEFDLPTENIDYGEKVANDVIRENEKTQNQHQVSFLLWFNYLY